MAFPLRSEVEYPESDGQPMAETDIHRDEMLDLLGALKDHFRTAPDVYVSGNLFLYYVEGNPRRFVAPDVFVVRGVPKRERRVFKLWEEGHAPCFVLELTSDSTRDEDLIKKKDCYERLGVAEYLLYDPWREYLKPPLQGFRLQDGRYEPIEPGTDGSIEIQGLGLRLQREGGRLRLVDLSTDEPLLREQEARDKARALEGELARLRRELQSR